MQTTILNRNNMTNIQEQALVRLLEIQSKNHAKREEMRMKNSYEYINSQLSRQDIIRTKNRYYKCGAFKSKSSSMVY